MVDLQAKFPLAPSGRPAPQVAADPQIDAYVSTATAWGKRVIRSKSGAIALLAPRNARSAHADMQPEAKARRKGERVIAAKKVARQFDAEKVAFKMFARQQRENKLTGKVDDRIALKMRLVREADARRAARKDM